ncbi:MAG TPA: DUF6364 family protein [Puia sp.]|jgi:hypothetical protein|nr:DUF6364 family protein [Puia sp.]
MNTKLTIRLEQNVIEEAKNYAKAHRTSLSKIIENYLQKITDNNKEKKEKDKITPLVKSLSGIISLPKKSDHKRSYSDFLTNKYK